MTPTPHDNEWLKIVASACLGLVAGLIAESLKSRITGRRTRREVSNAIRHDLRLARGLLPFCRLNTFDSNRVSSSIELPAFEHYWTTNKPVFYESPHLRTLSFRCNFILADVRRIDKGLCTKLEGLKSIEEHLSRALSSKEMHFFSTLRYRFRKWRNGRKLGVDENTVFIIDGKALTPEEVVIVDDDGIPIPDGEGP